MNKKFIYAMLPALFFAQNVSAEEAHLLFQCTTVQGKQVRVSQNDDDTVHYRFGKAGAPELEFDVAASDTENGACHNAKSVQSWLELPHDGHRYSIYSQSQGASSQAKLEIRAKNRKQPLSTLSCRPDAIIDHLTRLQSVAARC